MAGLTLKASSLEKIFFDTSRTSDAFTHWKKTLRQTDSSPLQTQRRGVTGGNLRIKHHEETKEQESN